MALHSPHARTQHHRAARDHDRGTERFTRRAGRDGFGRGIEDVAARFPTCLSAWAELGERALDGGSPVPAYAFFRVGYHRGLDRIRQAGWRGSGKVPWSHEGNRGFLRSLGGLGRAARDIGETAEATRCADFLSQLAPDAPAEIKP